MCLGSLTAAIDSPTEGTSYDLTLWRLTKAFQKESRNVLATFVITYPVMEVSEKAGKEKSKDH